MASSVALPQARAASLPGRSFRLVPGILLLLAVGYAGKFIEQSIAHYGKAHHLVLPNIEYVLWAILLGLVISNTVGVPEVFRAGVATSGSYNKTLTPFGFQSERRSVWAATDVYLKVSPFFYADKLKTPLLIVHGEEDANPGTTPLQSVRLYEAIRGNGGTARLVMLPHEPHWYTAMESNEQLIYEMLRWFDKYVKNAPPR